MPIAALDPQDTRVVDANVAGEAALLVAKAHKLCDRVERGRTDRLKDKDAADVLRIMQTTDPTTVGSRLAALTHDPIASSATTTALASLDELFGRRGRPGIEMAIRALRFAMPEVAIETLCVAYIRELGRSAAANR